MAQNDFVRINMSVDDSAYFEASRRNYENLDFEAQRQLIVDLITSMTADVKERDRLKRDKTTHPLAHIKLSTRLESQLVAAGNHMDVLREILSQIRSSKKRRAKYTADQINAFDDTVANLNENIVNLENTIRYRSSSINKSKVDVDLSRVNFDRASLTVQEQNFVAESIKRWNERDEGFDNQLKEIGEAVDRIGEVALHIGSRAQAQAQTAIETVGQVESTTHGVNAVTTSIKKIMKRQRWIECYCRLVLIIIVLVLSGALLYMVIKRLKR